MTSKELTSYFLFSLAILAGIWGCDSTEANDEDPLLAQVYRYNLHLSHAMNYLPEFKSPEDSISQLRSYVETWVRDAVLLHEAEGYLPEDINIQALVEDYRASLIIGNYEQTLVEGMLDTFISDAELTEYYEKNKDQYQLEQPIVRCHFVKIPRETEGVDEFRTWWDSESEEDFEQLVVFSNEYADVYMLEDSTWYRADEISALIPPGMMTVENMRRNRSLRFSDDNYYYFLRISQSVMSTEVAPLSYIREQAIRYIMHKRKVELLEQMKMELYEREMQGNQIRILVQ